jgi:hypothetical protein
VVPKLVAVCVRMDGSGVCVQNRPAVHAIKSLDQSSLSSHLGSVGGVGLTKITPMRTGTILGRSIFYSKWKCG